AELDLPSPGAATRLDREQAFHNRRYAAGSADPRAEVRKLYRALRRVHDTQEALLRAHGAGRAVLEYGCADGTPSRDEPAVAGFVDRLDGIDIADGAIAVARDKAARRGLANVAFHHMDAEAMTFPAGAFDVAFGRGILHHLALERAYGEL